LHQTAAHVQQHHSHVGNVSSVLFDAVAFSVLHCFLQLGNVIPNFQQGGLGVHLQPARTITLTSVGVKLTIHNRHERTQHVTVFPGQRFLPLPGLDGAGGFARLLGEGCCHVRCALGISIAGAL
jgi:hypothetical protein